MKKVKYIIIATSILIVCAFLYLFIDNKFDEYSYEKKQYDSLGRIIKVENRDWLGRLKCNYRPSIINVEYLDQTKKVTKIKFLCKKNESFEFGRIFNNDNKFIDYNQVSFFYLKNGLISSYEFHNIKDELVINEKGYRKKDFIYNNDSLVKLKYYLGDLDIGIKEELEIDLRNNKNVDFFPFERKNESLYYRQLCQKYLEPKIIDFNILPPLGVE